MAQRLVVIRPKCGEEEKTVRLRLVLEQALAGFVVEEIIEYAADLRPLRGARILFAVTLGASGVNLEYYAMLKRIRREPQLFADCLGALILDGQSELYTKTVARELVFAANMAGCAFIGKPLVEGTGTLANFHVLAQLVGSTQQEAYLAAGRDLLERLCAEQACPRKTAEPEILVLHASSHARSNTYALWQMVRGQLADCSVTEIGLRNGTLADCSGCPYVDCLYFGERGGCLYGGVMVEDVYPAVERCQALVLLCPNYNDALAANLTAFINRLTALYRRQRFYEKQLFGLIVSGYSGGDIIAGQLISALCMNKTFFLPAHFCLLETANDAGSIHRVAEIEMRAAQFAAHLRSCLLE